MKSNAGTNLLSTSEYCFIGSVMNPQHRKNY